MTEKQERLNEIVNSAICEFNSKEQYLISRDLSERCICAKFAVYLDKAIQDSEFNVYFVDVEYNRGMNGNEYAAKMLYGHNAVVDLIVHKRGCDDLGSGFDNLICIEMKKSSQRAKMDSDLRRLRTMTDNAFGFCYRLGYMIVAEKKRNFQDNKLVIERCFVNQEDF